MINMYSSYGELCTEVYDISKPLGFSTGDAEYYIERLTNIKGKVLEAGCGTGRVLIPLLQAGIDIDGLDHSIPMLELCRSRCRELKLNPKLMEGEMVNCSLDYHYEAIIIPGGTFQLIEGREQAITTLNHFNRYLMPGGKLILDLFMPTDYNEHLITTRAWDISMDEVILLEEKRIEVNLLEQKIISLLKYEKWKSGNLIKSELQRLPLSWYGNYEFELLLEKAGYQAISKSADYKFGEKAVRAGQMITYEAMKI